MLDPEQEPLKKTENERMPQSADFDLAPVDIDQVRINAVIEKREGRLEEIKPHIPLKTYHLILEKLANERTRFLKLFELKTSEKIRSEIPQSLAKQFFEQRHLKPKTIRID